MENKHDVHYCENCPDKDTCPDRQAMEQALSVDPARLDALNRLVGSPEFYEAIDLDVDMLGELYASLQRVYPPINSVPPQLMAHLSRSAYALGYYRAKQSQPVILPDAQDFPERER